MGEEFTRLPALEHDEPFVSIVRKLSLYITQTLVLPSTFEQLRTTSSGQPIRVLVDHLVNNVTCPSTVNALLTLKWHFSTLDPDDRGLNETRANACEIVAWRFLGRLRERDAVDFCLYELPAIGEEDDLLDDQVENERSALLPRFKNGSLRRNADLDASPRTHRQRLLQSIQHLGNHIFFEPEQSPPSSSSSEDPSASLTGLNALEIAAVADAKKFLSQHLVQKIIYGIWRGEVVFWETLSVKAVKKPMFYRKGKADVFSRLRVPKYVKAFEVAFFLGGLALYYAVLVQRNGYYITPLEILLYVWLVSFGYEELSEFVDAGLFYYTDFWSSWDLAIILVGIAFFVMRVIGLHSGSREQVELAFDVLSLEALFLVPRLFSLLSLHPYFGTLIPCLKEMTKDFVKFMAVVVILFSGFLTTFTLLAREEFGLKEMTWILVKVFFGSSYIGFDNMNRISPLLGAPLMLLFVTLTQILLMTSLISILSNTYSKVYSHAREEYLFVYSVYVLEASTSNRLTHFYPPLNLIPLILIRPLRLFLGAERIRGFRILVLKITHFPIVLAILAYEAVLRWGGGDQRLFTELGSVGSNTGTTNDMRTSTNRKRNTNVPGPRGERQQVDGDDSTTDAPVTPLVKFKRRQVTRMDSGENINSRGDDEPSKETNADVGGLEKKVDDLTAKVEELTNLLLAQMGNGAGSGDVE